MSEEEMSEDKAKTFYTIDQNHINLKDYETISFSCHVERCTSKEMNVWQYLDHLCESHGTTKKIARPFIMHQAQLFVMENNFLGRPGKPSKNSIVRKYERK